MLRDFEIGQLRQDFELQLAGRSLSSFLAGNIEPILARDFPDKIGITRAPPRLLQINRAHSFPIRIAVFNQGSGYGVQASWSKDTVGTIGTFSRQIIPTTLQFTTNVTVNSSNGGTLSFTKNF